VRSNHAAVARLACALFVSPVLAISAFAQIQQSNLTSSLKDIEARSQVTIGSAGFPAGVSGASGLPVNTLAYPDGQIIYRVEFGLTRGEVVQMRESFGVGTVLQVKSVDFKDDRLELKLRARNGDSGRLKLMLGANWQGRMTNAGVLETISKFLSLPEATTIKELEIPSSSSHSSVPLDPPSTVAPTMLYSRPLGTGVIPGRLPEKEVQNVLSEIQQHVSAAENEVNKQARFFSESFKSFEDAYSRERGNRGAQAIGQLRAQLGNGFIPRTDDDVEEIRKVFAECLYLARIRSAVDNTGRSYGPGANSPVYQKAFSLHDIGDAQTHSTDSLRAALVDKLAATDAEAAVISVERDLDANRLNEAAQSYTQLSRRKDVAVFAYLQKTSALRADLDALAGAETISTTTASNVLDLLNRTGLEEAALSRATDEPITSAYLQRRVDQDKAQLQTQLQSIPAFQRVRDDSPNATRGQALHLSEAEAGVHLTNITDSLRAASVLNSVIKDQAGLRNIQHWYGEEFYKEFSAKANGIADAEATASQLAGQIESERSAQKNEIAKRQALADQRAALAGNIVNTLLIVTKLDEQFNRTQIMGYSMEAQKQRTQLRTLINENRAALSSGMWSNVRARFQQIIPGLTVWEASHAQTLLSEIQR
jgi:hypothetical protein